MFSDFEKQELEKIIERVYNRHKWNVIINTYYYGEYDESKLIPEGCDFDDHFSETIVFNIPSCSSVDTANVVNTVDLDSIITNEITNSLYEDYLNPEILCFDNFENTYSAISSLLDHNKLFCTVCSKDLTLSASLLDTIFDFTPTIELETVVVDFNYTLQKAEFNTCRSHAHFFSQVKHECNNFTAFVENSNYRLEGLFGVFNNTRYGATNSNREIIGLKK